MSFPLIAWTGLLAWFRWLARRSPPWSRRLLEAGIALGVLLATPLGANLLVYGLEMPVGPPAGCVHDSERPVVVLAGGLMRPARSPDDFGALGVDSLRRVFGMLALPDLDTGRALVFVGGGQSISTSTVMSHLAGALRPHHRDLRTEERSRSTWENATRLAEMIPQRRIVLVTSALHMKRAVQAFERQGFEVCPHPVDSQYIPPGGLGYLVPQHSAVSKAEAALHEVAGRLVYALR